MKPGDKIKVRMHAPRGERTYRTFTGTIVSLMDSRGGYPGALIEFDEPDDHHRGAPGFDDSNKHDVLPLKWLEQV